MTSHTFSILEYLDQLKPDGGSQTESDRSFHCPVCLATNFKVSLNTGKYKTFGCSCMDTSAGKQAVIKAITALGWHKPIRPRQKRVWVYRDENDVPLIEVHRQDDGDGKRRIWQKSRQAGKPAELSHCARPYRYQECLAAMQQGKDVFFLEGEHCVDAAWSKGIPATTTIGGTNKYRSEQYRGLFPEPAPGLGNLVLCPDRDEVGLNYMEAIAVDYPSAKWCYPFPDSFLWQRLPKSGGADIADWIEEGATVENIRATIGDRRQLRPQEEEAPKPAASHEKPNVVKRAFHLIETRWGQALRYNEYAKFIELNGEAVDLDDFSITLAVEENLNVNIDALNRILKRLAGRQSYHPVRDYLEKCAERHSDTDISDAVAQRYFGTQHPIYDVYLKRTLIAAVARIFEPGCKVDTALILQGPQGTHKSTFFQQLVGAAFFDGSLGALSDKDEILKMHMSWLIEWAELENVFRRKDISATKAFLSTHEDFVRPPYERRAVRMLRQSIIVGTTNLDHFLSDPTGNRRFWVIPVQHKIDLERLAKERDRLWGAAVAMYRAGEKWHLTDTEEQAAKALARDYQTIDPWEPRIVAYCRECRLTTVTTNELLTSCLEIEIGRQGKGDQMRVAECLKRLGWQAGRHGKARRRVWLAPDQGGASCAEQVAEAESAVIAKGSVTGDQPEQPYQPKKIPQSEEEQQGIFAGDIAASMRNGHGVLTERRLE